MDYDWVEPILIDDNFVTRLNRRQILTTLYTGLIVA